MMVVFKDERFFLKVNELEPYTRGHNHGRVGSRQGQYIKKPLTFQLDRTKISAAKKRDFVTSSCLKKIFLNLYIVISFSYVCSNSFL